MKSPNTATMNHVDAGAALLGETESVVVEAPTVEAALEAVVAQMGTSCQIIGVEKVSRGGIAGFFGKESYQVEVQRPQGPGIAPRTDEPQGAAAVDRVLEAAAEVQADRGPQTFGELFRSQMSTTEQTVAPTPEPSDFDGIDLTKADPTPPAPLTVEPAPDPTPARTFQTEPSERAIEADATLERLREAMEHGRSVEIPQVSESIAQPAHELDPSAQPPTEAMTAQVPFETPRPATPELPPTGTQGREPGEPLFTADHLVRSGLPFSFVAQLGDLTALDDATRLLQLAQALQPWCGPLPKNNVLVAGLRAERLAAVLQLPVHGPTDAPPTDGSAIWMCDANEPTTANYLRQMQGTRRLHVVDPSAHTLSMLDAGTIVSWSDEHTGFESLLFALERGLHLGYHLGGPVVRRATAIEVAIGIRNRLPVAGT